MSKNLTPQKKQSLFPLPQCRALLFFLTLFPILSGFLGCTTRHTPVADPTLIDSGQASQPSHASHPFPLAIQYQHRQKQLLFLAVEHDTALSSPTFHLIRHAFQQFTPTLVILEGFHSTETSPCWFLIHARACEKKQFAQCSEPEYAASLADNQKIPFIGGEPSDKALWQHLHASGISAEDFVGFYLLRQIPQWKRENKINTYLTKRANAFIQKYLTEINSDLPFHYRQFKSWYQTRTGKKFVLAQITSEETAPGSDTYIHRLSQQIGHMRDTYLAERITHALNRFDKVMVIYGGHHWLMLREMLEQRMGPPTKITKERAQP